MYGRNKVISGAVLFQEKHHILKETLEIFIVIEITRIS